MKVATVSQHTDTAGRKATQWTREKIAQLIELYRKHECLWNHWHDFYKCKVKRNRAIEEICFTLRISKFDFGKKIHNLRNQFNTEMKKLEQRVGEAGESVVDDANTSLRCKWVHFESLMFLRNVIEPRPGVYQNAFQPPKKMRLRFDYNSAEDDVNVTMLPANNDNISVSSQHNEEISQSQQYEENDVDETATEEYHNFEMQNDQKYQPISQVNPTTTSTINATSVASNSPPFKQLAGNQKTTQTRQAFNTSTHAAQQTETKYSSHTENINLCIEDSSGKELNANNLTVISSSTSSPALQNNALNNTSCSNIAGGSCNNNAAFVSSLDPSHSARFASSLAMPDIRDQWDAFGDLVATELRNLNSDISRKKLKRKIMQAMLEVGEQDDAM